MTYSPGSPASLEATFTRSDGQPVDPDTIYVDIFDPDGTEVVSNATPTKLSVGTYQYIYSIANDATLGLWRADWQAVVGGLNAYGEEIFEVATADVIVNPSESIVQARLRSRLGEVSKLAAEENGSDTLFTTSQIADLLSYAGNDLDLATLEGWKRKAAHLARLIDVSESGTDRQMGDKYRQAKQMLDFWKGAIEEKGLLTDAGRAGRVVGKVINMRKLEDPTPGTPFSGYSEHIRAYPTHRFLIPAIL